MESALFFNWPVKQFIRVYIFRCASFFLWFFLSVCACCWWHSGQLKIYIWAKSFEVRQLWSSNARARPTSRNDSYYSANWQGRCSSRMGVTATWHVCHICRSVKHCVCLFWVRFCVFCSLFSVFHLHFRLAVKDLIAKRCWAQSGYNGEWMSGTQSSISSGKPKEFILIRPSKEHRTKMKSSVNQFDGFPKTKSNWLMLLKGQQPDRIWFIPACIPFLNGFSPCFVLTVLN